MSASQVITSIQQLESLIFHNHDDPRPVVVMTCGIAGSGKSTLSHTLLEAHPTITRLSIDAHIHAHHGLWNIHYPAQQYEPYQLEAEDSLRQQLSDLLQEAVQKKNTTYTILDFSFAFKESRDEWKQRVEENGGRWILVYLDVENDEIRRRVKERNRLRESGVRRDADSAFDVTPEILEMYFQGFERPVGEGEIILRL
ncbi:AAA domain-containing protein [Talaromyces proteolyticus]|uniref:AAA domain-containing protein n=1 Tax=Talaromyces proteolyticus TaxID=1131652 RepID=A0AAD4L1V5_9EURO|nr:AAA domain-containing protein [Talaromyces proteolyticus]KAH8705614.1 AAA domain-containing protein [Talaromyces proteolyticus]